jgi:glutamate dehydrogenase (NAD(P)+)
MYQGTAAPEIVTGKPVGSGGTLGRREPPVMALRSSPPALETLQIDDRNATAII